MTTAAVTSVALDTDQAKTIGIVAIVVLVVLGALVSLIISAIVGKLLTIIVVVGLAIFVWTQWADIESAAKKCDATFFGVHLTPSNPDIRARCQQVANR